MTVKNIFFLFFLFFFQSIFSQSFNFRNLEKEVNGYNRDGKQVQSQQILLKYLENENISEKEKIQLNFLLGTTYRSINDYATSILYLLKSKDIVKHLQKNDSLDIIIDAELSFAYFDALQYNKSEKINEEIYKKKFVGLDENNKAYIIMQNGYINFLQKRYDKASNDYIEALQIIKSVSPCNQPVVMVKQMQLFGKQNLLETVENTYNKSVKIADSCSILKYKIYATEEIITIFKDHNNISKAYYYENLLDSYNKQYNREQKLSNLHADNSKILEQQYQRKYNQQFWQKIILGSLLALLFLVGGFIYRKNAKLQKEKENVEKELNQIKDELKKYSELQFSKVSDNNNILNSEKLTKKQKELLFLVTQGLTNKEIAEKLFISEATVKYHFKNIYGILELKNRKDFLVQLTKN